MDFHYNLGQTPIDGDEVADLKLSHISTMDELNTWESRNIREAEQWAFKGRDRKILDDQFLRELHRRMFCDVWGWAGKYRTTNKNIGVDKYTVAIETKKLLEDTAAWIEYQTFESFEVAVRFHHRLVLIHPFPNGNGRHARLMTDVLVSTKLDIPLFTWGSQSLAAPSDIRRRYIESLRLADQGDMQALMSFVES